MSTVPFPNSLNETTRLYALPTGLGPKGRGLSFPLAGGPLSFTGLEIILAAGKRRLFETAFPLTNLDALKKNLPKPLKTRLDGLIADLTSPRQAIGPLSFEKPLLMGILNLTPDSFSDGGDHAGSAPKRARDIFREGADILDVGGESTRPGAETVPAAEELGRLSAILPKVRTLPGPVSVDTRKAPVMEKALAAGALIINDVSALRFDPAALKVAKKAPGVILMHAKGTPEKMQDKPSYTDVLLEVFDFLEERIGACEAAGFPKDRLVVDPGIGFGKTTSHNLALLKGLALFQGFGVPVLTGVSRKRFIGEITGARDPKERLSGSLSASLFALSQGAQIIRCHDVAEMRQAMDVYQSITSFG